MNRIVLLRHGESIWNKENRFTGWVDVPLSKKGRREAREAGRILKEKGYTFDVAYCSVLKRAIETLEIVLDELGIAPQIKYSWRLNERHYGSLQGLNKAEMAKKFGEEQVMAWRRSYSIRPPPLSRTEAEKLVKAPLYAGIKMSEIPRCESLRDTVARLLPYWKKEIAPMIRAGKRVLISAHGNSIRAVVKYLDRISDSEIVSLNIPTGIPLVYELDSNLMPIRHYYLGDEEKIKKMIEKIANAGRVKAI
ncbi:MAG: 2,3-diphosphoglycerate-dependent phosphoglycerate mutase [Candidatus Anstonellales archaeon]